MEEENDGRDLTAGEILRRKRRQRGMGEELRKIQESEVKSKSTKIRKRKTMGVT